MIKTNIQIKNMTCHACEKLVTKRLSVIEGVQEVKVDVKNGSALITAVHEIHKQDVVNALEGTDYQVINMD